VNTSRSRLIAMFLLVAGMFVGPVPSWAHVTFRPNQPLRPKGSAEVLMVVPTERPVATIRVSIEVPDAFLKAGGRLSRVDFPAGWQVRIEKEDKPDDIYSKEETARTARGAAEPDQAQPSSAQSPEQIASDARRKWIKRVTFEGGAIPPDGFKDFLLSFQLPEAPGEYHFSALQTYASGEEVSWSELVKGAAHPAPTLLLAPEKQAQSSLNWPLILSGAALAVALGALAAQLAKRRAAGTKAGEPLVAA
jgi:uncharacterized protein YcnI